MSDKEYWVYILLCANQSYYTGYTDNLEKRFESHLKGRASKYTRSFKPIKIAQAWRIQGNRRLAMQLERKIKQRDRQEKIQLIMHPELLSTHPDVFLL